MGTGGAAEALDARSGAVRAAPTAAAPPFLKKFSRLSLRIRIFSTTFPKKGRVGAVGRDRPAFKRFHTVARVRSRYGRGTSEARSAALSGRFRPTAGEEDQFDADRELGAGPLAPSAHAGAVSLALGRLGWPRGVCGRLRRSGGAEAADYESVGRGS